MEGLSKTRRETSQGTTLCTTALACLWGVVAAYLLFYSLIVTHHKRLMIVELVPLLAVWATLERKRWGRLAMIGLSLTILALFALMAVLHFASPSQLNAMELKSIPPLLGYLVSYLEDPYDISMHMGLGILALAGITCFWFSSQRVASEFNYNKRSCLANAQLCIACVMVSCWGVAILLNPMLGQAEQGKRNYGRASVKSVESTTVESTKVPSLPRLSSTSGSDSVDRYPSTRHYRGPSPRIDPRR